MLIKNQLNSCKINIIYLLYFQSKDVPKMGGPNSLFAGLGTPPGFPGISPLGVTPPDPLRKSNSSSSLSSPLLVPPPSSSSGSNPGPKVDFYH